MGDARTTRLVLEVLTENPPPPVYARRVTRLVLEVLTSSASGTNIDEVEDGPIEDLLEICDTSGADLDEVMDVEN